MKKILKLSLAIIAILLMVGNSYVFATTSCKLELQSTKTQYEKEERFTVNLYISDIKSDKGMLALDAVLEYDKDSLTLEKFEGQNGWETPLEGASYNKSNGKIAIKRNDFGKNNEIIFKMTFKVNKNAKSNATIALKSINIADGIEEAKFAEVKKVIEIKEKNQVTGEQGGNTSQSGNENENGENDQDKDENQNAGNNQNEGDNQNAGNNQSGNNNPNKTQSGNTNKNDTKNESSKGDSNLIDKTTTKDKKLPKTGDTNTICSVLGATIASIATISATYFFFKIVKKGEEE